MTGHARATDACRPQLAALLIGLCLLWTERANAGHLILAQVASITLPGVSGRIDHMDFDVEGKRLFVAALGDNSLEVVDVGRLHDARHVAGLSQPQGVRFIPSASRLLVANGRSGSVDAFSTDTFSRLGTLAGLEDADNVRLDPRTGLAYVGHDGGIAVIDPRSMKRIATIPLAGHPEAFQLEQQGARTYVNVPSRHSVVVVDRDRRTVVSEWQLKDVQANYPMALDEGDHRLFVAARHPAMLIVLDTTTGREVARVPTCADSDDLFYDGERRRIYVVCGEGAVAVVAQAGVDEYRAAGRTMTRPGARTGLYVPTESSLYIGVPARGGRPAEIIVLRVHQDLVDRH